MKSKKKTVKGYAVVGSSGVLWSAHPYEDDAVIECRNRVADDWEVIPATITYQLPKKML